MALCYIGNNISNDFEFCILEQNEYILHLYHDHKQSLLDKNLDELYQDLDVEKISLIVCIIAIYPSLKAKIQIVSNV